MREIKFRGISLITNDFIYGSLIMYNPVPEISDCTIGENDYEYHSEEVDIKTIGQFADLQDKHQQDIYGGDIVVQNIQSEYLDVSDWKQVKGEVKQINGLWCVGKEHYPLFAFKNEIIGNIHKHLNQ